MIYEWDKVYIPYRLIDETDNAGNIGIVTTIIPGEEYDGNFSGDSIPPSRVFTVQFKDWSEEGFHLEDLEKFKTFKYLSEWWIHEGKEWLKAAWIKTLYWILLLLAIILILYALNYKKQPEPPKPVDRVEQLGQLKADIEVKKGVELATQRDLKKQIKTSIDKVTGYDNQSKEYTTEQLNIVNGIK